MTCGSGRGSFHTDTTSLRSSPSPPCYSCSRCNHRLFPLLVTTDIIVGGRSYARRSALRSRGRSLRRSSTGSKSEKPEPLSEKRGLVHVTWGRKLLLGVPDLWDRRSRRQSPRGGAPFPGMQKHRFPTSYFTSSDHLELGLGLAGVPNCNVPFLPPRLATKHLARVYTSWFTLGSEVTSGSGGPSALMGGQRFASGLDSTPR